MRKKIYRNYVKRILDIIIAFIGIIVSSPIMLIAGLAIVLESKGKPIFKQIRCGQFGKEFTIYKFRSMFIGSEKSNQMTSENDNRITIVGNFLRKTSIDELPQLFNVLNGTMSVVGQRPRLKINYDEYYSNEEKEVIFKVKPGITGYAQVYGRSSLNVEQVKFYEMKYVEEVSFFIDFKIILLTFSAVLKRKGVN